MTLTILEGSTFCIGDAMQDQMIVQNQGPEPVSFELTLEVGSDFADIFTVKSRDFALGDPVRAKPLPPLVVPRWEEEYNQFVLEDREDSARTLGAERRRRALPRR